MQKRMRQGALGMAAYRHDKKRRVPAAVRQAQGAGQAVQSAAANSHSAEDAWPSYLVPMVEDAQSPI